MPDFFAGGRYGAASQAPVPASATMAEDPAIGRLSSGGFVVAYVVNRAITVQRYDADGAKVGVPIAITSGGSSVSNSQPSVTGLAGGGYAIGWFGANNRISVQTFDANGNAASPVFGVGGAVSGQQQPALTTLASGDFVVSWTMNGSPTSIRAQIFHANGAPASAEIVTTLPASSNSFNPQVAALAGGGFVVTWSASFDSTGGATIHAQAYDAAGTPQGSRVRVDNVVSYHDNFFESVAALATGGYVLTWTESGDVGGAKAKVMGQLYGADGTPAGGRFQVNTTGTYNAGQATVAAIDGGGFVVTWRLDVPGSGPNYFQAGDIFAQFFDAAGQKVGEEFRVNDVATDGQDLPVVTGFGTDDVAIVWRSTVSGAPDTLASRTLYSAIAGTEGDETLNGTSGVDYVRGLGGRDRLFGDGGNDTLVGGDGADLLHGGTGDDIMIGGMADDEYYVDSQGDQIVELTGEGNDVIYTQASYVLAAGVSIERIHAGSGPLGGPVPAIDLTGNEFGQLIFGNSMANVLSGLGGNDWLRGYEGNDTLYGGDDSDTLDGGTGADTMHGGQDGDTYIVDNAGDVVVEEAGGGYDTVEASVTYTLPDHFEYLTLTGGAAIDGTGNALDNYMIGNAAANVLRGLTGDDTLIGGLGNDRLDGGAGVDTARFAGARGGYDITYLGGGEYRVAGTDGVDTLKDIEQLQFGDRLVTIKSAFKAPVQWSAIDAVAGGLKWLVGDFTGDGKDDLFRQTNAGGDVLQSNGLFFAGYNSWTGAGAGSNGEFYAGDFNGDGKDDLLRGLDGIGAQVLISDGSRFSFGGTWSPAGSGSDGRFFVGDFNGDGKDDLLRWMDGIGAQVLVSSGSSFSFAGTWTPAGNGSDGRFYIGDFNGDGKDDIMRGLDGIGVQVFLSTGSGFAAAGTWTPAGNGSDSLFHIADFNGDGKDDVVRQIAGVGMQAFLSTGASFSSEGVWSGASVAPGSRFLAGDFTGGGTGDMVILGTGGIEIIA